MTRMRWIAGLTVAMASVAGCASGPLPNNPQLVGRPAVGPSENPLFVPQGQDEDAYRTVFERAYDVVNQYFDIAYANRFGGEIATVPLVSAGYFDAVRMDFYNNYELLESTLQTIRRRTIVRITPADNGGYYIEVEVYKELEDLATPMHGGGGIAVFHAENPVERQYDVVSGEIIAHNWIPIGRDAALEALILSQLKKCL